MTIKADARPVTADEVVTLLHSLAETGVYAITTGQAWRALGCRHLRTAIADGRTTGRIAVRRTHVGGGGKRRRWLALPQHARHLPGSGGAR